MAAVELTAEELKAIGLACMNLNETVHWGHKKRAKNIREGDCKGADWLAAGIAKEDDARVTLRGLLTKSERGTT